MKQVGSCYKELERPVEVIYRPILSQMCQARPREVTFYAQACTAVNGTSKIRPQIFRLPDQNIYPNIRISHSRMSEVCLH